MTSTDLAILETVTAATVFAAPGGVDAILKKVVAEVRAVKTDISTPDGRAAVTSLAYKVARSKTALDDLGKDLSVGLRTKIEAINTDRRIIRDTLDALKQEVRKPLTDWENVEKDRIEGHERGISDINDHLLFLMIEPSVCDIMRRIAEFESLPVREWHEFAQRAGDAHVHVCNTLRSMLATAVKREEEREELERLRRENEARLKHAHEEQIAMQAAEKVRVAAEEAARVVAAAVEAERLRVAASVEAERARAAAEAERIAKAAAEGLAIIERERIAAEERAAHAEAAAERERVQAAERAELAARVAEVDRAHAIEAERARVARIAQAEAKAAEAREANTRLRAKTNNAIQTSLCLLGLSEDFARSIVIAIENGTIPNLKIIY